MPFGNKSSTSQQHLKEIEKVILDSDQSIHGAVIQSPCETLIEWHQGGKEKDRAPLTLERELNASQNNIMTYIVHSFLSLFPHGFKRQVLT